MEHAPDEALRLQLLDEIDRAYRRWVKAQAERARAREQLTRAERGERRERELLLTLCDVRDEKGARR